MVKVKGENIKGKLTYKNDFSAVKTSNSEADLMSVEG